MKYNRKNLSGQLLNFAKDSYLERTSRPVYAIMFLLPFIVFYEVGTILINTDVLNDTQIRVVAFVWMQNLLEQLGFGHRLAWAAPPIAVVVILAALQLSSGKKWEFFATDILPMVAECATLAVPLIVLTLVLNRPAPAPPGAQQPGGRTAQVQPMQAAACAAAVNTTTAARATQRTFAQGPSLLADIVTGIGAGIYEELVFRLILICLLMLIFQDLFKLSHTTSIMLSVFLSAALFSAHHHIIFLNGRFEEMSAFNLTEFGFRTVAGIYFAVCFAVRGFGITAGTHAFYDIIATIINARLLGH